MKVLILITKSNWGGAQRYVYDLATNLPKDEFEVEVMAGGDGVLVDNLKLCGINVSGNLPIKRDISILEDISVFFKLLKIFRTKKPDVLHLNSSKIGGVGALAGRLAGIKNIIFTAHGWAFNENRSFISKKIIKLLHWITIVLSNKTILVSEALSFQMINWPFIKNKMTIIYNGIRQEPAFSKVHARNELAKFNSKLAETLKSKSFKDTIIIGSVGELHHIKGYEYAIRALHDLNKKILYLIIGTGEDKEKLEKLISDLKMESNVILVGFVPQASQYFKAFDIFLLPSLSEGFPYIALEAGLASLPVIASAVGGIPEIIEDMKSGILIQPRKPKEIRHALEFYITHKKVQKEHSTEINKRVLRDFTIEQMVNRIIEVYNKKY
jgi:glycosyltransferase involved in cell wall biosynthesis